MKMNFRPPHNNCREKSGVTNKTNNLLTSESALSVCARLSGAVPEHEDVIKTAGAGKQYRKPYHDKLDELRRDPNNCGRCGKPNNNGHRQCDNCLAYQKRYKAAKKTKPITAVGNDLDALLRRVASLEISVARLQLDKRDTYKRGYRTGQAHERKVRFAELPEISVQELSTINHAYESPIG